MHHLPVEESLPEREVRLVSDGLERKNAESEYFYLFYYRGRMDREASQTAKNEILLVSGNRHGWKLGSQAPLRNGLCELDLL